MGAVVLAFAGMAVVAFCAVKVHAAVRHLAGELERARARILPERAALKSELGRFAPSGE